MDQQYPGPGRKGLTGQEGPEAVIANMTSPAPDGKGVGAKLTYIPIGSPDSQWW